MNVLITGAAGFIGSALAERLAADGHRLAALDSCAARWPDGLRTAGPRRPDASAWLNADIAGPAGELRAFLAEVRPDAVIHLAAQASVVASLRDPVRCAEVNVCGTVKLLQCCLAAGVRRFVFASTAGAMYGDAAPRPTPETAPTEPRSPYGASKAAAEHYVRTLSRLGGMHYAILRLGNVYGRGQAEGAAPGVVAEFARAALERRRPVIFGDGQSTRDYVYVDDVLEAHRLALRMRGDGVFNIASGTARTVREVFDAAARAADYGGEPQYAPPRRGELRYSHLDVTRAARVLGWRAQVPFGRGVALTVEAMRLGTAPGIVAGALC